MLFVPKLCPRMIIPVLIFSLALQLVVLSASNDEISESSKALLAEDANIPQAEMDALLDFYNELNGPEWRWYKPGVPGVRWNFTSPRNNPCLDLWEGIACLPPAPPFEYRYISEINLVDFNLHGTIPPSISTFNELKRLILPSNRIYGSLPDNLGDLTLLSFLEINNNNITGTLPVSLESWTDIQVFYLDYNAFTGTIPAFFGNLRSLNYFDIGGNFFVGTIPSTFGNLSELAGLDLSFNQLTGTIPVQLGQLARLKYVYLNDNQLRGSLPQTLGSMQLMQLLDASSNQLTGSIPNSIGNLTHLHYIYLDHNELTGTIPASIGTLSELIYLTLNTNHLRGTVPPSFSALGALQVLLIYENSLTGRLDNVFNAAVQTHLETVQLNDNQLTGDLPEALFHLPVLNSLVAVGNCLHSNLPATACNNTNLQSLVLDGLSSAPTCRSAVFSSVAGSSYVVSGGGSNQIPSCLFALPNITTLHLSGNGYTGSLPGDVDISPYLVDVSLSHNRLTGDIPVTFQLRKWYNLDLSYNRLSGSLVSNFEADQVDLAYYKVVGFLAEINVTASNHQPGENITKYTLAPSVTLENNRLSGKIPSAFLTMNDVSILGSNVFSCNLEGSNLPDNDSGKNNYQCGSDSFDVPYYVWLSLIIALLGPTLYVWRFHKPTTTGQRGDSVDSALSERAAQVSENMQKWLNYSYEDPNVKAGLYVFNQMMDIIWFTTLRCMVFAVLVLLPIYTILSYYYGRLKHPYAWTTSAAYLTGAVVVALVFPLLVFLLVLFLYSGLSFIRNVTRDVTEGTRQFSVIVKRKVPFLRKVALYSLFVFANIVVVVGVNVIYVYIAIYESSGLLIFAQVLLSLFKIVWNGVCTSNFLRSHTVYNAPDDNVHSETEFASLQVFVTILNNIVIPCMVVAVISPSCFYNIFVPAPAVETPFTYDICFLTNEDGDCVIYLPTLSSASYTPPFIYNYQCSSSLVTYYAPAFVILCIVRSIATPVMQAVLYQLHRRATKGTRWHALLDLFLPPILKPISADASIIAPGDDNQSEIPVGTFFDATRVLITMISYLGLLLTFGVVFPPLAVSLAVTVFVIAYSTKLGVGRFLTIAIGQNLYRYLDVIERECRLVASVSLLHNSLWMLITVSCWFYTLFLFDTLGDSEGFDGAFWLLFVMPLMPAFLYAIYRAHKHWQLRAVFANREQYGIEHSVDHTGYEKDTFNVLSGAENGRESVKHANTHRESTSRASIIELPMARASVV